jgi:hypothetical protein
MRRALTSTLVVLAVVAPGCGGGDEKTIPRENAARLVELLQEAQIAGGDQDRCDTLLRLVPRIQSEVADLPSSVDDDTRQTLEDGVDNLGQNARSECSQTDTETTETETTPPTTTETVPPTTTETVPPPTTTEEEPPPTTTEEEPPPPTEPPEEPTVPPSGGTPPGNGNGPEAAPGQQQRKQHEKKPKPDKGPKPGKGPKH